MLLLMYSSLSTCPRQWSTASAFSLALLTAELVRSWQCTIVGRWGIYKLYKLQSIAVGRVTIASSVQAAAATLLNARPRSATRFAERALLVELMSVISYRRNMH